MKLILQSIAKRPLNIVLILLVIILYFFNNLYLKEYAPETLKVFFVGYFNDLICPLLFFSYVNILLQTVNKELTKPGTILLIGICVSVVWEFVAPILKPSSVTDPVDIICYITGSMAYWLLLHCSVRK